MEKQGGRYLGDTQQLDERAVTSLTSVFGLGEEQRDERLLGGRQQLDDGIVDWILVLIQPTLRVVANLQAAQGLGSDVTDSRNI